MSATRNSRSRVCSKCGKDVLPPFAAKAYCSPNGDHVTYNIFCLECLDREFKDLDRQSLDKAKGESNG